MRSRGLSGISRARQAIARHGPIAVARYATAGILQRIVLHEEHVWYRLSLDGRAVPPPSLPDGLELVQVAPDDLRLALQLPWHGRPQVEQRLASGSRAWVVADATEAAFGCWAFAERTPAVAAPAGWLTLPARTACIEDVETRPAYRGRGIAPAALRAVAERLRAEGYDAAVAKVDATNRASRRAFDKAGFRPAARMHFRRIGPIERARIVAEGDAELASLLAAQLESGANEARTPTKGRHELAHSSGSAPDADRTV